MNNYKNKIKKNISTGYIYNFFMSLEVTSAVWVLYLGFRGMSLVQIGLLEAIFHITGLIFEMPTGAIADVFGRKFSVVLGRALNIISAIIMITSSNFYQFAIAFVFCGASYNLNSGAFEALVYDSLKELDEEEGYKKLWGNISFLTSIAQAAAVIIGGIVADIRFVYVYILSIIIQTIAMCMSLRFCEPLQKEKANEPSISQQIKESITILKGSPLVIYIIVFTVLLDTVDTTIYLYGQKYFSDFDYTKTVVAIIFATSNIFVAIASKFAYRIESWLKPKKYSIMLLSLNIFSILGLAFFKQWAIVFFMINAVTGGLGYPVFSDYINSRIPSQNRATILSFQSLCFSAVMICAFPAIGFLAEKIGLVKSFGSLAILLVPLIFIISIKIKE